MPAVPGEVQALIHWLKMQISAQPLVGQHSLPVQMDGMSVFTIEIHL